MIFLLRDALLGFSVIPDTSEIYHGDEDGEGIDKIITKADLFLFIVSPFVEFGNNLSRHKPAVATTRSPKSSNNCNDL